MKIETARLEYVELNLLDVSKLEKIATDMAWNDTVNLLLKNSKDTLNNAGKEELCGYQEQLVAEAEKVRAKKLSEFTRDDFENLYEKIPNTMIPQEHWHINFSLLKPNFRESALAFVNRAKEKSKEEPRQGFWLGIKEKSSGKLIGATTISTKVLKDSNGVPLVGHSGQFIHPSHQRKGYICETKAVMVDFMYKYLADMQITPIPENAAFYTTCDQLNKASQGLQEKSGATWKNRDLEVGKKMEFQASRDDIMHSKLLEGKAASWRAQLDNGKVLTSQTGKDGMKILYSCQDVGPFKSR